MRITIKQGIKPGEYADLIRNGNSWEVHKDGQCIQKLRDLAMFRPLGLPKYRLLGLENNEARVIRFADLHRHSDNSLLDGMTQVPEMVKRTEYAGALTDHGNMYGFLQYYELMREAGKKPIIGFEGYMENLDGKLEGRHVIFLAKSEKGVKNLFKLVSEAFDNFKRKPHVTWAMMRQYHEDVMCLSACLGGIIPTALKEGRYDDARRVVEKFISIFGKEDFYLEIQRHGIPEEVSVNAGLERLAQEYGLKLVATTDSHYPTKEDSYTHEVLLCLQTEKTIDDPKRMRYDGSGYHLQTSEEMEERFKDMPEVLDNTLELADKVDIELKLGDVNLPNYDIPKRYATPMDYLFHLAKKGYQDRFGGTPHEKDPVYQQRFDYEINMIKQMGFASYFIIVWDFINYARKNNIYVGPGRGSAAGSIVAYCLGITDLDPIKYDLLFERFLNPERVSWPD